jgi:serine/threonine protein kinase
MKIDPAMWPALSRLLDDWLDLPSEARPHWLENLDPSDAALLPALRELLAAEEGLSTGSFLQTLPKIAADTNTGAAIPDGLTEGARIGPYRLIRELGRGGMSVVWLAARADGSLQREVALKLPFVSPASRALAVRFERERDILAGLVHPNIARLYDAGADPTGQPYLALEFVEGEPINVYCDRLHLSLRSRLAILLDVVRAVQYAHTNLIIHRDLKPSNILVTSTGAVRLLDFGIAKLTSNRSAGATDLTGLGGQPLTPEYASPEQIAGEPVTAASDVYSLGVLLYELATGARPYRLRRNTRGSLEDAILEADVMAPSQAVPSDAAARARGSTRKKLSRALRGDLDNIALKALQRQARRRYASAEALAQDLERYLRGEAVLAQPQSTWYRVRKFARRNWVAVASAAAIVSTLSIGLGVALVQTRHAQTEAAISKALSDFVQDDLLAQASARAQSGPNSRPNPDLRVRDALDRAAARINGRFDSQPLVEASIRETMGRTYRDLGLYREAQVHLERAMTLRRRTLGMAHLDTLHAGNELGVLYTTQANYTAAEPLLTEVLAARLRLQPQDHRDVLGTLNDLAVVETRRGKYAQATAHTEQVLEIQRRVLGPEHPDTVVVMHNLAVTYLTQGKFERAEELLGKVADVKRRTLGPEHPSYLGTINNLGIVYRSEGKYAQSESTLKGALDVRLRVLGERHPDTLDSKSSLALLYQAESRYSDAEPILLEVLEARRSVLGEEHSTTLASLNNLAELYRREGKSGQAEQLFTELLAVRRRALGAEHPNTIQALASLGNIKLATRQYPEAESLLRAAVEGYRKGLADSWQSYYAQSMLAEALAAQGRTAEAEPLLTAGYAGLQAREHSIPFDTRGILAEVGGWAANLASK